MASLAHSKSSPVQTLQIDMKRTPDEHGATMHIASVLQVLMSSSAYLPTIRHLCPAAHS